MQKKLLYVLFGISQFTTMNTVKGYLCEAVLEKTEMLLLSFAGS